MSVCAFVRGCGASGKSVEGIARQKTETDALMHGDARERAHEREGGWEKGGGFMGKTGNMSHA